MRPAERRQEVVQRVLVGQVDDAESDAKLRPVRVQQIVDTDAQIEEMTRRNSRWIRDIVGRSFGGNPQPRGAII